MYYQTNNSEDLNAFLIDIIPTILDLSSKFTTDDELKIIIEFFSYLCETNCYIIRIFKEEIYRFFDNIYTNNTVLQEQINYSKTLLKIFRKDQNYYSEENDEYEGNTFPIKILITDIDKNFEHNIYEKMFDKQYYDNSDDENYQNGSDLI